MPRYDYRCEVCGQQFEAKHGFNDPAPACPKCQAQKVQRLITTMPAVKKGMSADAGHGGTASKEQLRSKWAEETPKLREKLVSKLGEDMVSKNLPELKSPSE